MDWGRGSVLDQGLINCLDSVPVVARVYIYEYACVGGVRKVSPRYTFPDSRHIGSRDSGSMEATWRRASSPHSRHTAAWPDYQHSEHIVFEDAN